MVASASAGLREHEGDVEALLEVEAGCAWVEVSFAWVMRGEKGIEDTHGRSNSQT